MSLDLTNLTFDAWWAEVCRILLIPFSGESVMSNYALAGVIMLVMAVVGAVFSKFGKAEPLVDFSE